jgi:hypothetical protein
MPGSSPMQRNWRSSMPTLRNANERKKPIATGEDPVEHRCAPDRDRTWIDEGPVPVVSKNVCLRRLCWSSVSDRSTQWRNPPVMERHERSFGATKNKIGQEKAGLRS